MDCKYALAVKLFESEDLISDNNEKVVQRVSRGEFLDWLKENRKEILEMLLEIFTDDKTETVEAIKAKYRVQLSPIKKIAKALAAIDKNEKAKELFE